MTVQATTPALTRPRLDVGLAFKGGWNAFTADIVPLLVGALIAGVLSVITLGILAGPLTGGLYSMVVGRIRDGRKAEIGDVFSCMDRFWSFFAAALILVVLIGLASITIVGGVLLAAIWMYVFPLMVDRKLGAIDAMGASYRMVVDGGFWEHLAVTLVFVALNAVADGLLAIVAVPFTIAVVGAAYFVADGRGDLIEHPVTATVPPLPTTPPAPPTTPAALAAGAAAAEASTAQAAPAPPAETPEAPPEPAAAAEAPPEPPTAPEAEPPTAPA